MSGEPPIARQKLEEFLENSSEPFGTFTTEDGDHWILERSMVEWFLNELPQPSQASLDEVSRSARRVRFIEGGCLVKPLGKKVVLDFSDAARLGEFARLLRLVPEEPRWHCMCRGDYAIELEQSDGSTHYLGFHHGHSLRRDDVWGGDATLAAPLPLLEWLAGQGLNKPLQQFRHDQRQAAESQKRIADWLAAGPEQLRPAIERWLASGQNKKELPKIYAAAAELPVQQLVPQLLGWCAYRLDGKAPMAEYEALPAWILDEMQPADLVEAARGELSRQQLMGLAVLLFQPLRLPLLLQMSKQSLGHLLALLPREGAYQFGEQLPLDYEILLASAPPALTPLFPEVWKKPGANYADRYFEDCKLERIQELVSWTSRFPPRSHHAFRVWLELVDGLIGSLPLDESKPVLLGCAQNSGLRAAVARHIAEARSYRKDSFADFPKGMKAELMALVGAQQQKILGERLGVSTGKNYLFEILKLAVALGVLYLLRHA
jgi:hypothetical protein